MSRGEVVVRLAQCFVELAKAVLNLCARLLPVFLAWHLPPPKKKDAAKEGGQGNG